MRIVFVCTTNVWGSAMAELMTRSVLSEWDPDRRLVQVYSAGVRARIGAPIPASGQQVLAERGLDGSGHRARWLTPATLADADLTLTMGELQRDAALALNPRGLRSTFTVLEAAQLMDLIPAAPSPAQPVSRSIGDLVAEMAAVRRFRMSATGSDDLPDLVPDEVADARRLADELVMVVHPLIQALIGPQVAGADSRSTRPTVLSAAG